MKKSCKKLHPERIKMLKAGFPLCYGNEHCNSCKKDYEKRFQEISTGSSWAKVEGLGYTTKGVAKKLKKQVYKCNCGKKVPENHLWCISCDPRLKKFWKKGLKK